MAELKIYLPEDMDTRFRKTAMNVFGYGRGSLSRAAVEAIQLWCNEKDKTAATVSQNGPVGEPKVDVAENTPIESKVELPQEPSMTKDSSPSVASGT